MTDKRREDRFFQKKSECFFAIEFNEGTESYELNAVSDDHELANLPADAIITNAYIHVKTGSDAATSAVATLGTTEGGTEILSAGDLTSTGKQGTFTGQSLTGAGQTLWFGVTYTGAATNVGEYVVVVEYLEYKKNTGDYTSIPNI